MEADFDIRAFGACPDGTTNNAAAIQSAIDACYVAGGGRVLCGPGRYVIGSLSLKSNVELYLAAGCQLVGSTRLDDYREFSASGFHAEQAPEGSTKSLIQAADAENIAITGPGEICGSGLAFYDTQQMTGRFFRKPGAPRPRMVMMYRCRNVRIHETSFTDSPCWTFWLMKCERVTIHRVKVTGDQRMINNDGIDLDACRDVTLSDSVFKTGDDCLILRSVTAMFDTPGVCENISVTNCVLDSWCQGIRVGCPGDGIIRNCVFSNLVITSAGNGIWSEHPWRYLPDGMPGTADIYDILFSNIVINCANTPIGICVEDGITLPRLARMRFSDISIHSGGPCLIQGCADTTIRDIHFNNVQIATSGNDALICRHCEGVKLTNVELTNRPPCRNNADHE